MPKVLDFILSLCGRDDVMQLWESVGIAGFFTPDHRALTFC